MDQRYNKYGQVYGMYLFYTPQLVVGDVDMLKDLLVRDWHVFADRTSGLKTGDPIMDKFLTSLSGNEWKRMRSVMSPTFTSGKMKQMFHIMNDCGGLMTENIRKNIRTEKNNSQVKGFELDVRHLSGCYTMDVIAKCCFATDTNSFDDPNAVFVTQARNFFNLSKIRLFFAIAVFVIPMWIRTMFGIKSPFQTSIDFFGSVSKTILDQRRRDGSSNEQLKGAKDYLQLLIDASKDQSSSCPSNGNDDKVPDHESHHGYEEGNEKVNQSMITNELKRPLTDEEIIASSVLFLVVGYDTTGSLITMTNYLLALNPDKQEKLFEELEIAHKENGGKFDYETISGLKYLDAVISETLRLLPSAPFTERRALEDYTFRKNGIFIPKRGSIILPIWNMHHDPRFWTDPMKFEPERFLPENRDKIVPYSYIPFGGGPRNCIGMRFALLEAKLAIAHLVLNFKLSRCSKTDVPLDFTPTVSLLNAKRVFVGVQTRDCNT